jgi:hypothetical protein
LTDPECRTISRTAKGRTLRPEPLGEALARFDQPATVISESPDEASHQAVRAILAGSVSRR